MGSIHVDAEAAVGAPASVVYGIIADYREHHPRILPPAFSDVVIEEGGVGAGTVFRFQINMGGRRYPARTRVDEPHPGSVLTETDLDTGLMTTFTVTSDGEGSRVRFDTVWEPHGLRGVMERLFAPRMLRGIYADELRRLDEYAREQTVRPVQQPPAGSAQAGAIAG